jgi:hypothetical protein
MVEIEIGVLRGQCLDRRTAKRERLETEVPPGSAGAMPRVPA